jgi:hypothetical protein
MTKKQTDKLTRRVNKMTQADALYSFLLEGNEFSSAEAKRSGIADPSRVINKLRGEGFAIYLNDRKTRSGDKIRRYRLGSAQNKSKHYTKVA